MWEPNENGTTIRWNGGEKFYSATEWLEYIIKEFIKPNSYILNGVVEAKSREEHYAINCYNNVVRRFEYVSEIDKEPKAREIVDIVQRIFESYDYEYDEERMNPEMIKRISEIL